ncbi:hypothetical protein V9T40_010461 [Parthenolecanium corni]|uniref:Coiled-coil domain-containing protein 86 n=1 Tax=Parthenolecanium corni TaxID=536013 RepID=A0AAN9TCE3_9HEMI
MEENKPDTQPRGMPKSGRFWKDQKSRFATVKKSPGLKTTFVEKQKFREDLKRIKSLSRELLEQRNAAKEAKKQKRKENIQRRKENESKAEILQVIKNPAKLKRMKKKALKQIQKRDTLNLKT